VGLNRHIRVKIDDVEIGTMLLYAGGDYDDWKNSDAMLTDVLTVGQHSLTITFIEGYWRLRLLFADLVDGSPSTVPPTPVNTPSVSPSDGEPTSTPGTPSTSETPVTGPSASPTGNVPVTGDTPSAPRTDTPHTNTPLDRVTPISEMPTVQHNESSDACQVWHAMTFASVVTGLAVSTLF
jgi:hypothetical protein